MPLKKKIKQNPNKQKPPLWEYWL